MLRDKPGQTAPETTEVETVVAGGKIVSYDTAPVLFTPSGAQQQYAICSPITDESGAIYFKNDSAYLMALTSTVTRLEIAAAPAKTVYRPGESFDPAGMQVLAHYANGYVRDVTKYVTWDAAPLTEESSRFRIEFPYAMYQNADGETGVACVKPAATLDLVIGDAVTGDVNGDGAADDADAAMVYAYVNGKLPLTDAQLSLADVDGSGKVDAADAAVSTTTTSPAPAGKPQNTGEIPMRKRITALLLAGALALGLLPAPILAAPAGDTVQTISTAAEFAAMDPAGCYRLAEDVTITAPFPAVFTGSLDGGGHTVTLALTAQADTVSLALFPETDGASIQALTITGTVSAGEDSGLAYAAALAGSTSGDTEITACKTTARLDIAVPGASVGGLTAAQLDGTLTLTGCAAVGEISAPQAAFTGGLVGRQEPYSALTMQNCYQTANITGGAEDGLCTGGLIGSVGGDAVLRGCWSAASPEDHAAALTAWGAPYTVSGGLTGALCGRGGRRRVPHRGTLLLDRRPRGRRRRLPSAGFRPVPGVRPRPAGGAAGRPQHRRRAGGLRLSAAPGHRMAPAPLGAAADGGGASGGGPPDRRRRGGDGLYRRP